MEKRVNEKAKQTTNGIQQVSARTASSELLGFFRKEKAPRNGPLGGEQLTGSLDQCSVGGFGSP